jgi:hypothetical protein
VRRVSEGEAVWRFSSSMFSYKKATALESKFSKDGGSKGIKAI